MTAPAKPAPAKPASLTKGIALGMLPMVLKWLATADTAAVVKDAGDACRELIPDVADRKRVGAALAGLARELEK